MTQEQRRARAKWDLDRNEAERIYRWALESYNDGIREARKVYDAAMAAADKEYFRTLETLHT